MNSLLCQCTGDIHQGDQAAQEQAAADYISNQFAHCDFSIWMRASLVKGFARPLSSVNNDQNIKTTAPTHTKKISLPNALRDDENPLVMTLFPCGVRYGFPVLAELVFP